MRHGIVPNATPTRTSTKTDPRARPTISLETSEADWSFFLSEWKSYKSATGIDGSSLLEELWRCMKMELKRLAINQGGKETLISVPLMLNRIKNLAVRTLHANVHVRDLHDFKQTGHKSVNAYRS